MTVYRSILSPSFPYDVMHDLYAIGVFLIFFVTIMFFYPDGGGYVIEYVNYEAADNLKTPEHIVPSWVLHTILCNVKGHNFSSFGLSAKFLGFVVMAAGIAIFVALPWLDRSPVKSIKYKGIYSKFFLTLFCYKLFCFRLPWLCYFNT